MDAALKFLNILQVLDRHGVDFILVGGVAAILEGAHRTLRLEMVIRSKEEANREKNRAVLPVLRQTLQMKKASAKNG